MFQTTALSHGLQDKQLVLEGHFPSGVAGGQNVGDEGVVCLLVQQMEKRERVLSLIEILAKALLACIL